MNLAIEKTPSYHADVTSQFGWYFDEVREELASRFFNAAEQALYKFARQPDLGRRRKFRHLLLGVCFHFKSNVHLTKFSFSIA